MREIKFRAWNEKEGSMIYERDFGSGEDEDEGFIKLIIEKDEIYEVLIYSNGDSKYFAISGSPMQFTGLKDKNGKEIYEGDIIKADKERLVVKWNKKHAGFSPFVEQIFNAVDTYSEWRYEVIEVIGNVFENPELLTSKGDV